MADKGAAPSVRTVVMSGEMLDFLKRIAEFAKEGTPLHWGALLSDSDDLTAKDELLGLIKKAGG